MLIPGIPTGSVRMANWRTGELATLQDYLSDYRLTLRIKCERLDAEQLACRCVVPPSTMSLRGLLRHLAEVERDWRNWITPGDPLPKLYGKRGTDFDGAIAKEAAVHRIEEYARHAGHADRLRGSADQLVAGYGSSGTIAHWRRCGPA